MSGDRVRDSVVAEMARDERGATAVVFAVSLLALAMTAGLAMISADRNWAHTETQNALDSAVLAAAIAPSDTTEEERIAIAERIYAANQIIPAHDGAKVEIEAPATFGTTETTVYGTASVTRTPPFVGLFGADRIIVPVKSAATKAKGAPVCVLGLDATEEATMDFNGKASLEAKNCAAMTNSAHGAGMRQVGQPSMKAEDIGVTGGYSGDYYEPQPTTAVPPFADPYASLPNPPAGPCDARSGTKVTNETITLDPGTYCGGISLQAGSIVTLNPGIYVMQNGPLDIQAGAAVTGHEVLIAFLGPDSTLYLSGTSSLAVTSPKSGTYANIQFFGDRDSYGKDYGWMGNNMWFTVIGNSTLTYDGVLYAPSFNVWLAGGSIVEGKSPSYIAVAKKLWFQDNTVVTFEQSNSRGLDVEASARLERSARLFN